MYRMQPDARQRELVTLPFGLGLLSPECSSRFSVDAAVPRC